jgi:RNA polymerase sigma factor (sigma-70 family)
MVMPESASVADLGDLVQRARAGDNDAWIRLITRFRGLPSAIARGFRLAGWQAEDVEQTTWLRLFESIDRVRNPERLPGWLATTARRECLHLLRNAAREAPTDDLTARADDSGRFPAPEDDLLSSEARSIVTTAVHALPDHHRRLLETLLTAPDSSYTEVARSLDMPVGSIGPTRARGIDRLRHDPQIMALAS